MRLIDADELKKESFVIEEYGDVVVYVEDIDNAPTIEAESVKHGKWELVTMTLVTDYFMCSECSTVVRMNFISDFKTPPVTYNYCPYCGAKMDK